MCTKKETGKHIACHVTQHSSMEDKGTSLTSVKSGQWYVSALDIKLQCV